MNQWSNRVTKFAYIDINIMNDNHRHSCSLCTGWRHFLPIFLLLLQFHSIDCLLWWFSETSNSSYVEMKPEPMNSEFIKRWKCDNHNDDIFETMYIKLNLNKQAVFLYHIEAKASLVVHMLLKNCLLSLFSTS